MGLVTIFAVFHGRVMTTWICGNYFALILFVYVNYFEQVATAQSF